MTASRLQVQPIGMPLPIRVPPRISPARVSTAVRCLFGVPDPLETTRLYEEEVRRSLAEFRERFAILDDDNCAAKTTTETPEKDTPAPENSSESGQDLSVEQEHVEDTANPSQDEATNESPEEAADESPGGAAETDTDASPAGSTCVVKNETKDNHTEEKEEQCEQPANKTEAVDVPPPRCNPGALGNFRVRKFTGRPKPYSSTKQTLLKEPKDCFRPPRSSRV